MKAPGGEDSGVAPRSTDGSMTEQWKNALHASAEVGQKCADCTIDEEPCPTCYAIWWKKRHPNHDEIEVDFQAIFCDLSSLLDAIESALGDRDGERAEELVKGRFEMVEKHGLRVEFTSMPTGAGGN